MRFLDLILSMTALFILSPLFVIVIVILAFTGEGEVFFYQNRIGKNGKEFRIIKFATMLKASPNMGTGSITAKHDPRILPVGKYLRKTKINELPQLINILRGDMSIVGPRPHVWRDLQGIKQYDLELILTLTPGLSGVGSLIFRDEEKILQMFEDPRPIYDNLIAPYKAKLEIWYLENRNFWLYCKIIIVTIYRLFLNDQKLLSRLFIDLPQPSPELKKLLSA